MTHETTGDLGVGSNALLGWQPMTTAPRDGRRILVAGGIYWKHYGNGDCSEDFQMIDAAVAQWDRSQWQQDEWTFEPEAWQPLPLYKPKAAVERLAEGSGSNSLLGGTAP